MAVATEKALLVGRILELHVQVYLKVILPTPAEWLHTDLTMPQLKTLLALLTGGPVRMGRLASALGVSLATTTGVVDRLVERGLVQRESDPEDRRVVLCRLSDQGQELASRLWASDQAMFRSLLETVAPAKLRVIAQAMEIILDAASATKGGAPTAGGRR